MSTETLLQMQAVTNYVRPVMWVGQCRLCGQDAPEMRDSPRARPAGRRQLPVRGGHPMSTETPSMSPEMRAGYRLLNVARALRQHGGEEQAQQFESLASALVDADPTAIAARRDVALAVLGESTEILEPTDAP